MAITLQIRTKLIEEATEAARAIGLKAAAGPYPPVPTPSTRQRPV